MASKGGIGTFVTEDHELATDSLDLFTPPTVEGTQIAGKVQTYYLHGPITNSGPYEFIIPNDSNDFTQLDFTQLHGCCEVTKADGTVLAEADKVSVINNFPQTLFKQIELYLNNVCVSDLTAPTYPYKTFIENHLTYDNDLKTTTLEAKEMYIKDTVGKESAIATGLADTKSGLSLRKVLIQGKKIFFDMKIHLDFLQSKRYLLPGVEMKLKLIRNDDAFSIMADAVGPKIKMNSLELKVRRITIDPMVATAIESRLATTPALYPIAQSKIKTYLLNSGIQSQQISQITRGKLPRSFIIGFVSAASYDGSITTNPFIFKHFNLNYLQVFVNGEPIFMKAMTPKWDDGSYVEQYTWFQNNIGLHQHVSNGITLDEYRSNTCLFPFDLTPDWCNNVYGHGSEQGAIDISIAFTKPLTENVMMLFYATYDETVVIDKDRNISIV